MRNSVVFCLPLLVIPIVSAAPAFAQSSFTGSYAAKTDEGAVALTLNQKEDGAVTGTLSDGTTELELRGRVVDNGKKVTGTFYLQGKETPISCEIRKEGAQLRFTMIVQNQKTDLIFSRTGGSAPEEKTPASPTKPEKPEKSTTSNGSATSATGTAFRHPTGISFRLPDGWTIREAGIFYVLLPPGQSKPPDDEGYLLVIARGEGTGVARLGQNLEAFLLGGSAGKGLLTDGERTGSAPGGATYEGNSQDGKRFYGRTLVSRADDVVIGIIGLGARAKIQGREKSLLSLVASVKVGTPERDSRFYGTWSGGVANSGIDARDASGRLQASSTSDSSTTFTFSSNGTYTQTTTSRTIAIGQGVSLDSGPTVEKTQLTWAASGEKIAFFTPGGIAVTGTYRFEGSNLVVSVGGKTYVVKK